MPRKARLDAPGTLHHVIIRGIERRPIVDDDKDRENFVSRLGRLAAETEAGIFAWTLMTNHAHKYAALIYKRDGVKSSCSYIHIASTAY